jgi:hypothetical protein
MKKISRWTVVVLVCSACQSDAGAGKSGADEPSQAMQGSHLQAARCDIESPWLVLAVEPPVAAAIGTLIYATQDPVNARARGDIEIRWVDGRRSTYVRDELLWSPEGETVPVLGEMHPPAVFAVNDAHALVWGNGKGWGCAPRKVGGKESFSAFSARLDRWIDAWEKHARTYTNADGYSLHANSVLTVQAQPLRSEPRLDGPISGAETKTTVPCLRSSTRLVFSNPLAPDVAAIKKSKLTEASCFPAVRIVERNGEWARLILPRADRPIYDFDPGLAIAWDEKPAGWARIAEDGPVPGSRLIRWSIKDWWNP